VRELAKKHGGVAGLAKLVDCARSDIHRFIKGERGSPPTPLTRHLGLRRHVQFMTTGE
jgi:hypothetical protein